tara:strand:- start:104867 stop:105478 length:612 start_codon:yes stop_codon:yes gene_type:complete
MMTQETQKQTAMKVLLASGLACVAWMFLVKPVTQGVVDLKETLASQSHMIETYQQKVGNVGSVDSAQIQQRLNGILTSMATVTSEGDSGTALHSLINEAAGRNGVSMARIETIKQSKITEKIMGTDQEVNGVNHLVRLDFEGDYGSVIAFMNEVVTSSIPVKFSSFRLLPTGVKSVRVNAEINSVMLTSIPSDDSLGGQSEEQ